jgi:hypothetical protein
MDTATDTFIDIISLENCYPLECFIYGWNSVAATMDGRQGTAESNTPPTYTDNSINKYGSKEMYACGINIGG